MYNVAIGNKVCVLCLTVVMAVIVTFRYLLVVVAIWFDAKIQMQHLTSHYEKLLMQNQVWSMIPGQYNSLFCSLSFDLSFVVFGFEKVIFLLSIKVGNSNSYFLVVFTINGLFVVV